MSKAKERAQDLGYGTDPLNRAEYTANEVQDAFIDGYEQAEKDLELTWKDIETIQEMANKYCKHHSSESRFFVYSEVLKRFKDLKK